MEPIFKQGDKVTSPIEPGFLGMVSSIITQNDNYLYTITYYHDGQPKAVNMFGFELEVAPADNAIGFHSTPKED